MPYLMIIQIGPVQEFIASARRSRDLWFGSWLLSELSKAAAQTIADKEGLGSLIFPAPQTKSLLGRADFNVANKIVAIVQNPKEMGEQIKKDVPQRLNDLWEQARQQFQGELTDKPHAEAQIMDLLELNWIAVPYEDVRQYEHARRQAEALLAARKRTHEFKQGEWRNYVPKSSLDGTRESVIPETRYPQRDDSSEERKQKIDVLYELYGAGPAERLSAVDLLKRHGNREQQDRFPSTSHIASLPLLDWLKSLPKERQTSVRRAWESYLQKLPRQALEYVPFEHPVLGHSDGSMLFEARLRESSEGKEFEETAKHLHEFLKNSLENRAPLPYYGLLVADGDRMGEAINQLKYPADHQRFSSILAGFAKEARTIIENHRGALIYAGGDDLLALLPLHTALACASALAATFATTMQGFTNDKGRSPTLSAGFAVSHHIEPMSDALELARDTEKAAKQVEGKDALAITISKRSGVDVRVAGHWRDLCERLERLTTLQGDELIPDGAAYELRDLARRFTVADKTLEQSLQRAILPEARRILERKRGERGRQPIPPRVLKEIGRWLGADWSSPQTVASEVRAGSRVGNEAQADRARPQDTTTERSIEKVAQLADELIIARLLAKAAQQATTQEGSSE